MNIYRILILEDDLSALSILMDRLSWIERKYGVNNGFKIAATVLSEFTQVEELINPMKNVYDVILLDRDCKARGNFHVLDFNKFSPAKIVSISTCPEYIQEAKELGVVMCARKNFSELEKWGDEIEKILVKLLKFD